MHMKLTNRDEVAGLPALSLAEFFAQCDAQVTAGEVGTWFHLDGREKDEAIHRLIDEGYLELKQKPLAAGFIKTNKALAIERSAPAASLEISAVHSIVLTLFEAVGEANSSPATAHRVGATTFIGAAIDGSMGPKALVEAVIELEPLTFEATLQAEFERLAYEYATMQALPVRRGDDPYAASIWRVKDRLLDTHERLSLRFVVR